jgi:hypothetical protein
MTPEERKRWSERLKAACPIKVTDEYPGNPDYIETREFEQMVDVIEAAVEEEREACASIASTPYGDEVMALGPDEPRVVGLKIAAAIRARQAGA